jgi:hypothetical protein
MATTFVDFSSTSSIWFYSTTDYGGRHQGSDWAIPVLISLLPPRVASPSPSRNRFRANFNAREKRANYCLNKIIKTS